MRYAAWIAGLAVSLCGLAAGFSGPAQATGDANHPNAGECPAATEASPGFRAYLPDCRAYELVTPPFKYGAPTVTNGVTAVASDGSSITFSSIGAFGEPGDDATPEGGEYVDTRGATGWSATPVNPSALQFQGGSPTNSGVELETLDYSSDLTRSLFLQAPIGAKPVDARFYVQDLPAGPPVEVGPLLAPQVIESWNADVAAAGDEQQNQYYGATADLSHIVFDVDSRVPVGLDWLWPGDTTVRGYKSLYEYVGVGNSEPELVGVKNDTSLTEAAAAEHKPHVNEAAEQIGQCGVYLGGAYSRSESIDTYNAISSSGKVIFFTVFAGGCTNPVGSPPEVGSGPPVKEIYARLDRDRTVAISEPTAGSGGDCVRCDESELQDAIFQGASEDGTKVFFLSAQKLFGGTEGEAGTNLYEYDFDAPPGEKLSFLAPELSSAHSEPGGVVRVVESGARVYFVSQAVLDGAGANEFNAMPEAGADNLYVYDIGARRAAFVAQLSPDDQNDWQAEDGGARNVEATPDGRFLLFPSIADLTPDASGPGRQLYRYDATPSREEEAAGVPRLVRVTVGAPGDYECPITKKLESGFDCNGNDIGRLSSEAFMPAYDREAHPGFTNPEHANPATVAISADGSRVFFQSPVGLTPGAVNDECAFELYGECWSAVHNVYEWENGRVYLISDGHDTHSYFTISTTDLIGANPSGSDVFLTSRDSLLPEDADTQADVYDARVDGGYPSSSRPAICMNECHGPASSPPAFGTPASAVYAGTGNLTSTVAKRRHVTRRKVSCAKRRPSVGKRCTRGRRRRSRGSSNGGRRMSRRIMSQTGGKR
jgi:hypothetical protein